MSVLGLIGIIMGFNLLAFGNGPALVPLLQHHFVEATGLLTLDQFLYCYAVGRVTPGQANLYLAAIGYMIYGWLGAVAVVIVIQVPGYIVLPAVKGYEKFRDVRAVRGFTRGLTASSLGLMLYVAYDIGRDTLIGPLPWIVLAATLGLIFILRWNALLGMLGAAALGLALKLVLPV